MVDPATASMIANMPAKTGRSLDEWLVLVGTLGLDKHGQIVSRLKAEHGIGHGFANLIAQRHFAVAAGNPDEVDLVDAQYAGPKVALRPAYERLVAAAQMLGDDVEVAPKKTVVSLRRAKQFAQIQPMTGTRIDVGLNLPGDPATERLKATTGMCTHKVAVTNEVATPGTSECGGSRLTQSTRCATRTTPTKATARCTRTASRRSWTSAPGRTARSTSSSSSSRAGSSGSSRSQSRSAGSTSCRPGAARRT